MQEQVIKNDNDFAEDKGLQFVKSFLMDNLQLSGLYCFGIHHKNKMYSNAISGEVKTRQHTHYYLLVYTIHSRENAVADLSDIIKKKSKGQYTVTLFIHKATTVRQLTPENKYFYYHAMHKGINLHEHDVVPPCIAFEQEPERNVKHIKAYWHNRNRVSEVFLQSQGMVDGIDTEPIQEAMMQVAMENTALALINTFLGYRPIHFNLGYLFDICSLFCTLVREFFPRNSAEEIKMFELLSKNISKLRSAHLGPMDFLNTELLQRRCRLFHEKATVLIESEIERLEKLNKENKQQSKNESDENE
ncbi:hypothetical protein V1389_10075 [Flavobacterium rakeshii]|uniref:hypothetical protein n=1 Tax=Flavobacterium rakeshii TaxID=1038845 RepID=UPI002E7B4CBA|nr:hypothetical protein [Flavobacterium rakeshii]MEE1898684.1 hypothetical protein [Flavobacterium rakeshii]